MKLFFPSYSYHITIYTLKIIFLENEEHNNIFKEVLKEIRKEIGQVYGQFLTQDFNKKFKLLDTFLFSISTISFATPSSCNTVIGANLF